MTAEQHKAETHTVLLILCLAIVITAFAIFNILIYNNYYRNHLNLKPGNLKSYHKNKSK